MSDKEPSLLERLKAFRHASKEDSSARWKEYKAASRDQAKAPEEPKFLRYPQAPLGSPPRFIRRKAGFLMADKTVTRRSRRAKAVAGRMRARLGLSL